LLASWSDGGRVLCLGGTLETSRQRPRRADASEASPGGAELDSLGAGDAERGTLSSGADGAVTGAPDTTGGRSDAEGVCSPAAGFATDSAGGLPRLPFFLRFDRPNVLGPCGRRLGSSRN
jgi:hypothetical protein